jgi:hypothetical protein
MRQWALALLALGASSVFAADLAKGTFHFGAVKFEPVDAIAFQVDGRDGKPLTIVAFTDFKIDRQGVLDAINTESALIGQINENQKGSYVLVRLTASNRCGLGGLVGNGAKQIDLGDSFAAKVSQGASRVAGECSTTTPGKMFDDAYDFHLAFDQPLMIIPKPTPLPAGGAEPGKAYAALVKAIQAADWNAAYQHLRTDEVRSPKPKASEMKEYFHDVGLNYPKTVTVTGGLIKGDRANLEIKGTNYENRKIRGVVVLRKYGDNWRVLENEFFFEQ